MATTNPFLETLSFVVIEVEDPRFEIRELQPALASIFSRRAYRQLLHYFLPPVDETLG